MLRAAVYIYTKSDLFMLVFFKLRFQVNGCIKGKYELPVDFFKGRNVSEVCVATLYTTTKVAARNILFLASRPSHIHRTNNVAAVTVRLPAGAQTGLIDLS